MKKPALLLASLWGVLLPASLLLQAQQVPVQELASRQALEERLKQVMADYQSVLAAQEVIQKRLSDIETSIRELRSDVSRMQTSTNQFATTSDVNQAIRNIEEVDKRREQDKKVILQTLRELEKLVKNNPSTPAPAPEPRTSSQPFHGYQYTVQKDDTLTAIVEAYRREGVEVTVPMVKEANPGLIPERMQVGQVIRIPDPSLR